MQADPHEIHNGNSEAKLLSCSTCKKTFTRHDNYIRHINFRCNNGNKKKGNTQQKYATSNKIAALERIRNGESKAAVSRDFKIPESTIRSWCKNEPKIQLMPEKTQSTKNEQLTCQHCLKTFNTMFNLKRHMSKLRQCSVEQDSIKTLQVPKEYSAETLISQPVLEVLEPKRISANIFSSTSAPIIIEPIFKKNSDNRISMATAMPKANENLEFTNVMAIHSCSSATLADSVILPKANENLEVTDAIAFDNCSSAYSVHSVSEPVYNVNSMTADNMTIDKFFSVFETTLEEKSVATRNITVNEDSSAAVTRRKEQATIHEQHTQPKTGEPNIQNVECHEIGNSSKCLECLYLIENCRFNGLRILDNKGKSTETFLDPFIDPTEEDLIKWMPSEQNAPSDMDIDRALYIFSHIASTFSTMISNEITAHLQFQKKAGLEQKIVWKRWADGILELCDVCASLIFNYHYICGRCGFAVCLECFYEREKRQQRLLIDHFFRDDYGWILCNNDAHHTVNIMQFAQVIPGDCLRLINEQIKKLSTIYTVPKKKKFSFKVIDVAKEISKDLWNPESFNTDFGNDKCDLIDCKTGLTIKNQIMNAFWTGFMDTKKRIKIAGSRACLKLKDWPNNTTFKKKSPYRFYDLMRWVPCADYTKPDGIFNLASRLPSGMSTTLDLGPKLYVADGVKAGSVLGTTNLHLDVSDVVNVAVHVHVPENSGKQKCSSQQLDQYAALWHIFDPRDIQKLRIFLREVTIERNICIESKRDDVIHSQSWYLDECLLLRLYKKYQVKPITRFQNVGEAIFIPAGSPHKVKNVNNCIKVAIDFVSPENIPLCYRLAAEFRNLPAEYLNHEDKLQLKNIIYFTMKDVVSVLKSKIHLF